MGPLQGPRGVLMSFLFLSVSASLHAGIFARAHMRGFTCTQTCSDMRVHTHTHTHAAGEAIMGAAALEVMGLDSRIRFRSHPTGARKMLNTYERSP